MSGWRLVRAFVWLHWRQQANALRGGRRGLGAKIGAWAQLVVRALLALTLAVVALALGAGMAIAGLALVGGGRNADGALFALRVVLGAASALTLVLAALRAGITGIGGLERLLLLPLSRKALHRLAAVTFLADPWLLGLLPGLLVLAGFLLRSGPVASAVALVGGALFLLAVGSLASALAQGIRLLLRDRRRAEAVLALGLLAFIVLASAPGLMVALHQRQRAAEAPAVPAGATEGGATASEAGAAALPEEAPPPGPGEPAAREPSSGGGGEVVNRFPWPLQVLPSEAFARAVGRAAAGEPLAALPSLAALGLILAVGWTLSRGLWSRLVSSPAAGGHHRTARLPSWRAARAPEPLAVAGAFVRVSLRTVQGKLALVSPTIAMAALSVIGEAGGDRLAGWMNGPGLLVAAGFMSLTVQQNSLFNMFGIDRGGLTLELLSPATGRRLLAGRALGGFVLATCSLAPALLVAPLVGDPSPAWMAGALFGFVAAYALLFPVAAWLSLLFPKAADLGKLGQEGKPQPTAALLGFLGLLVALVVVGGVGIAGGLAAGAAGAVAAEALLALVSLVALRWLLTATASFFESRREAVYLAVRGS